MTQKKAKAEIPADMWLHVATDALARWAAAGGSVELLEGVDDAGEPALFVLMSGMVLNDPRLAPAFAAMAQALPDVALQQ